MNISLYIAKRLLKQKETNLTRPIVRIAQVSIMLCFAVMIVAMGILQGFKKEIRNKISGFCSHVQIKPYSTKYVKNNEATTFYLSKQEKENIKNIDGVVSLCPVVVKPGVLINKNNFQGVVVKGINSEYDSSFFVDNIRQGHFPLLNKESKQEVLLSLAIKNKLNLELNDKIKIYFYTNGTYRAKNFYISGFYDTGLADYDELMLVCDMRVLQNIFSIDFNNYSYYELRFKDFSLIDKNLEPLYYSLDRDKSIDSVVDLEPNLFAWLNLLDSNVVIILIIMIVVCIVTLSSMVLIMIYEKKYLIGILKSFGANNKLIMKIFIYKVGYLTLKGMLYGNILAIGLELLQKKFHLIALDQESYFLSTVPVDINIIHILLINIGVFAICMATLVLPCRSINKLSPTKNMKSE
ncbi:MAG: FtsX-like permease family protein [Bacteroidota bacterium]|nr:FtsX-like permease family protein [Bacteroidota bacterium]